MVVDLGFLACTKEPTSQLYLGLNVMNPTKYLVMAVIISLGAAGAVPVNHPQCGSGADCTGGDECCPLRGVSICRKLVICFDFCHV